MARAQRLLWRWLAAIAVVGAAAVAFGWGMAAAGIWLLTWGILAVLTYTGTINPIIILALVLPASAAAQEVSIATGWLVPGKLTGEPTNHVRVESTVYQRLELAFDRTDRWGGYLAVTMADSWVHGWPAGTGKATWWDLRAVGGQSYAIDWSAYTLGARYRVLEDLVVGLGGGPLILTTDYHIQGASPTTSVHAELAAHWTRPVHDGFRIGLGCWAQPALLYGHEWVRHWAAREFGDDDTHRTRGNLVVPSGCDLQGRVTW